MIDLKEACSLQKKYLLEYNNVHFINGKDIDYESINRKFDLVISNYSFSELSLEYQQKYFEILNIPKDSWLQWFKKHCTSGSSIGYDPRMHRVAWKTQTEKILNSDYKMVIVTDNPIDLFWENRPHPKTDEALLLNEQYTGK